MPSRKRGLLKSDDPSTAPTVDDIGLIRFIGFVGFRVCRV